MLRRVAYVVAMDRPGLTGPGIKIEKLATRYARSGRNLNEIDAAQFLLVFG
jgi:hypothetical protein